ncbi:pirin family protein [Mucilaginibacter sp.]|uniref:pirin family protein n=1 Tax=Mucilaginibacter sp. TaxID=1882438 RepID=UPI0026190B16|nr:pirin family protein [Mucilaginibacter sp.]MDB5031191.1 Pirin-like protein [Mucilaginibacter sp.]
MKTIAKQHQAVYEPIGNLITYRVIPTASIDYLDPFLFLNHHGPQFYQPNNNGLPFGPHPHRGFETVTIVIDGDIYHKDSGGFEGTILPGGVQWMTAGKGLIHTEVSSEKFKKKGGNLEILQLWVNLPSKFKMIDPFYRDLQQADIPVFKSDDGKVSVKVIAGKWEGINGVYSPLVDISLYQIDMKEKGKFIKSISTEQNVFFYVIKGDLIINGEVSKAQHLVEFNHNGEDIMVEATSDASILLGHALPFNEPVVSAGPFVMNTSEEIEQAYQDYSNGKFGTWMV